MKPLYKSLNTLLNAGYAHFEITLDKLLLDDSIYPKNTRPELIELCRYWFQSYRDYCRICASGLSFDDLFTHHYDIANVLNNCKNYFKRQLDIYIYSDREIWWIWHVDDLINEVRHAGDLTNAKEYIKRAKELHKYILDLEAPVKSKNKRK